ncbi:hypothetical protein DICA2_F34464 [Diutina catenulata]
MTPSSIHHTARIADDANLLEPIFPGSKARNVVYEDLIQSSPYTEREHRLALAKYSPSFQALALALQSFAPKSQRYAFEPYAEAFNIDEVVKLATEYAFQRGHQFERTEVWVIAFRSVLHTEVQESEEKRQFLARVDKDSHAEANASGGLIKYWFGTPDDETARNLATCWWSSYAEAKSGGGGPAHREGMKKVKSWFKYWKVEEYQLAVEAEGASWSLSPLN